MKKHVVFAVAALVAVAIALEAWADDGERRKSHRRDRQDSFLTTMYQSDPLTHAISLRTGEPGLVFTEDGMGNHQSDLDFGHYYADAFTVGIEGGREGVIVDLGTQDELKRRYDYAETVGKGQGFAGLRLVDGKIIGKHGGVLRESAALFAKPSSGQNEFAAVHLDHIYLMRLTSRHDENFDRIAKLIVVGHKPDEEVTVRWILLRDEGGRE